MQVLNSIIFIFNFFLIFLSTIGYGIFFSKKILPFNEQNIGYLSFYGLILILFLALINNWFIGLNSVHNSILHLIGLLFFFLNKKKICFKELKKIFKISIILFSGLIIFINNNDFAHYHLPLTLNLSSEKIQFGMHHLNYTFSHISSLFFLNAITYLPFTKIYLFNTINFLIFIIIIYLLIDDLNKKIKSTKYDIEFFIKIFTLVYLLIKFSRVSDFGTDLIGQFLIMYCVGSLYDKDLFKNNNKLMFIIISVVYCLTLKTFFIFYIFIFGFIFFIMGSTKIKNLIYENLYLVIFFIILFLNYFSKSFVVSGCFIYPIKETCFFNFDWAMQKPEVSEYRNWYEFWSKAGAGPSHRYDGEITHFISNLNWINYWFKYYFYPKFFENFLVIILVPMSILLLIYKLVKNQYKKNYIKNIKNILFINLFIFLILSFWFFNHPTLRYGGYAPLSIFIFTLFGIFLANRNFQQKNKIKKIYQIFIIFSFLVFNIKNFSRIYKDFSKDNFINFPYFFIEKKTYTKHLINNYTINQPITGACWDIPSTCGYYSEHYKIENFIGYKMYIKNER